MMLLKRITLSMFLLLLVSHLKIFSQETLAVKPDFTYENLLSKYIERDRAFATARFNFEEALLTHEKSLAELGVNFEFSTGTIKYERTSKGDLISFSPEVVLNMPSWRKSKITVKAPISATIADSSKTTFGYENIGVNFSSDIVSPTQKTTEVKKLSVERSLFLAEQAFAKNVSLAEKRFLQDIQVVLKGKQTLLQLEEDYLESQVKFETVKLQGFAPHSAKYRTALLELQSAELAYENSSRTYETSIALFAKKCGLTNIDKLGFFVQIPFTELLNIETLKKDNFIDYNVAVWENKINTLSRAAETSWTLSGSAGYSFYDKDSTVNHNLNAGLVYNYRGFSVGTNFALPVNNVQNPSVSLTFGFSPLVYKTSGINSQINSIKEKKEFLAIEDAVAKYDSAILEKKENYLTLNWQLTKHEEELKLYTELESDMRKWLTSGVITEADYRNSKIKLENAKTQLALTKIARRLYNIGIEETFYAESANIGEEDVKN